ncbi:MAG: DUF805 domain-containing protein [Candidatus Wallbacteria bacterium]|nr:DUF805 domain-containing protein [Candidatus Wallbacteria bacterium]
MSEVSFSFRFKGRVSRGYFIRLSAFYLFLGQLIFFTVSLGAGILIPRICFSMLNWPWVSVYYLMTLSQYILAILVLGSFGVLIFSLLVKRCHDFNYSGSLALIMILPFAFSIWATLCGQDSLKTLALIPLVNLVFLCPFMLKSGTTLSNPYGRDPESIDPPASIVLAFLVLPFLIFSFFFGSYSFIAANSGYSSQDPPQTVEKNICSSHMLELERELREFLNSTGRSETQETRLDELKTFKNRSLFECPAGGIYSIDQTGETYSIKCSIHNTPFDLK